MIQIDKLNLELKKIGTVGLKQDIFGVEVKPHLVHQALLAQAQWARVACSNTKGRSDVRGGGKKPYKQKRTGSARRGSSTSPVMIGGGIVFGPKPRIVSHKVNKKEWAYAVKSLLSDKCLNKKFFVIDQMSFEKPSTKKIEGVVDGLKLGKALLVDFKNENLMLSARNKAKIKYIEVGGLNVYDMLKFENVIFSQKAVEILQSRFSK